jgi:hypothetical protein
MKIELVEGYVLTTDAYNFILNEVQTVQEGKNKGKEYLVAIGFYPTIAQLLEGLISKEMLKSRARTFDGFLSEHKRLAEEIRELFKTKIKPESDKANKDG